MIVSEQINNRFVKHYSDSGYMIRQVETGVLYSDATDIVPCMYTYEETDQKKPEMPTRPDRHTAPKHIAIKTEKEGV